MGEVYRARDTNLNRDVALKTLPDSFVRDPERVARFRREAQVLASLNHPNIGAIYGFEDAPSPSTPGHPLHALVLELVAGETLASRLRRGPMPIADALALARQIADALEAAHEHSIIHRDLKPANVVVTPDGVAKVLDFGLAKDVSGEGPTGDSSHSPTLTVHGTRDGVVLGTAAYMSPEQARGRSVDKRSDLWAFGAVLYEMLTGRRAFEGEEVSDILAHILTKEPDWQRLPADTPAPIVRLLRRCLDKDRKRRLDSAAAARLEIDEAVATPTSGATVPAFPLRFVAPWAITAAVVVALLTVAVTRSIMRPSPPTSGPTSRFAIVLPPGQRMPAILLDCDLAISPDGRQLVYRVGGSISGGGPLALRTLDEIEAHLLPGVDNARNPFFSADGRWIGFVARSEANTPELRKISTAGGPPITIHGDPALVGNATWSDDDSIIFPRVDGAMFRVPDTGGTAAPVTDSQQHRSSWLTSLSALPGGRGVLFVVKPPGTWFTGAADSQIALLDSKTGTSRILARGSRPKYVSDSAQAGFLVYASAGTLLAARFDLDRLSIVGNSVPVVEHVAMSPSGAVDYDVSNTGTLVYVPAGAAASRSLVWADRAGRETPIGLPARAYAFVRLSPDGTRVVLTGAEDHHLWIGDIAQRTLQQLTFGPSQDGFPIWSADGRSVIFTSDRDGAFNLYSQPADGSGEAVRLTMSTNAHFPNSAARDGRQILGAEATPSSALDVVRFAVTEPPDPSGPGPGGVALPFVVAAPLVKTPAQEYDAIISPDEHFFAYQSNESGRSEVYVKPLPPIGGVRWQISTSGGSSPLWAPKGRELYYRDDSNAVIAVPYETSGTKFQARTPTTLLDGYAAPTDMFNYDVSPDGQRFLMLKETGPGQNAAPANIVVVLNWLQDLKARVPTK